MKRDAPISPACKVTMQYRKGNGFVYELESSGVSLAVTVSRDRASGRSDDWMVAAHNGRNEAAAVSESGSTGAEALRNVERTWLAKAPELGLPVLDWNAIVAALVSVRAI